MKKFYLTIVALLSACSAIKSAEFPQRGENLPLYYDVRTGNVTIDTTGISGGEFVSYSLTNNQFGEYPFIGENHTPFMPNLLSPASTSRTIAETSWPNEPLMPGVYSIGKILPPGLSEHDLVRSYFSVEFLPSVSEEYALHAYGARGSFDLDPSQFHIFDINYSPSPFPSLNDANVQPDDFDITWATEVSIGYDPRNGELVLDSTGAGGGRLFGYVIELNDPAFRLDEFTYLTDETFFVGRADHLQEAMRIDEGVHSLGAVLPSGLDLTDLNRLIAKAVFTGEPGHGRDAIDVSIQGRPMAISIVPEPSISALWIAGWMFVIRLHFRSMRKKT